MIKYKKTYLNYFGYGEQDMVPSEYSGLRAEHIHHLNGRISDEIWNLMALTGNEHDRVHFPKPGEDGKAFNEELKVVHAEILLSMGDKGNAKKILQTLREGAYK